MEESILLTIKSMLGPTQVYDGFDLDIIMHINTALNTLYQFGVGPLNGYRISDETSKWTDITNGDPLLELIKTFVYLYVRNAFDPPNSSYVLESNRKIMDELAFRIVAMCDHIEILAKEGQ